MMRLIKTKEKTNIFVTSIYFMNVYVIYHFTRIKRVLYAATSLLRWSYALLRLCYARLVCRYAVASCVSAASYALATRARTIASCHRYARPTRNPRVVYLPT